MPSVRPGTEVRKSGIVQEDGPDQVPAFRFTDELHGVIMTVRVQAQKIKLDQTHLFHSFHVELVTIRRFCPGAGAGVRPWASEMTMPAA